MAWFLFIDESGHDGKASPYGVLAGLAIHDTDLWELINKLHAAEIRIFGRRYTTLKNKELKGQQFLSKQIFSNSELNANLQDHEVPEFAKLLLDDGAKNFSVKTLKALALAKLRYVREAFSICSNYGCKVFAMTIENDAPKSATGGLRKDYAYLFERFFYFLEDNRTPERGIVVFDELDKSQSHLLVEQTHTYFKETAVGKHRASLVIPEPFFVHSDLTAGVQIADLVAYILSWAFRLSFMTKPARHELDDYVKQILSMRCRFLKNRKGKDMEIWSIAHISDLRTSREILEE